MPALNPSQFTPSGLASDRAKYLQGTWAHGKGDTTAVVWTHPQGDNKQGVRYEGTHVSPVEGGIVLHGGARAKRFENGTIAEIHYNNPRM